MHIFIDEAGRGLAVAKEAVTCVTALVVPDSQLEDMTAWFLAIENEYGGPIKGRKIDQRLRDRILRELLKFDVFVECTAIDMSLHSIDAVSEHKEKRAHFIGNTPSTQNPFLQKMRDSFAEKMKKTKVPLYLQGNLTWNLVELVLRHATIYYSQISGKLESAQRAWYVKRAITQGEDMKREFPSTPEEAFETSNEGSYYGKQITKARIEGRIRKVYYDANVPVHTAWDLGYNDSTAIWFFQQCGQEIHLLEYYENSGEALTHYLQYLKNKPYTYGKHLVPHDAAVHEYSTGLSRVEVARNHGVLFTITPDIGVIEGVDAARNILLRCWFDEEKCSKGITALESYRKDWNEQLGCWASRPLHNFASHGADAFRMLAVGLGKLESRGLTAAEWRQLRATHI